MFSIIKAPQYANLDYLNAYGGDELDHIIGALPETEVRFVFTGFPTSNGGASGLAGMVLKPWGERTRLDRTRWSARSSAPIPARSTVSTPSSSMCRRCPAAPAGCRCR